MKRINTLVATTLLGATLGLGAAPAGAVDGLHPTRELLSSKQPVQGAGVYTPAQYPYTDCR